MTGSATHNNRKLVAFSLFAAGFLVVLVSIVPLVAILYIGIHYQLNSLIEPVSLMLTFIVGASAHSYFYDKWLIWIANNCSNLHWAYFIATKNDLLHKSGFMKFIEIKTLINHEQLADCISRLKSAKFIDDTSVPQKTIIKYSAFKLFALPLGIILVLSVYYRYSMDKVALNFSIATFALSLLIGILLRNKWKELIIIDEKGIKIGEDFYSWKLIRNEYVWLGYRSANKITFAYEDKTVSREIDFRTTTTGKLDYLLFIYRNRNNSLDA